MFNTQFLVDVNKTAKQCKKIGEFIMFKCKAGNLLVTSQFILNLTYEQFWKMRCKLEIPELGVWYLQLKDSLEKSDRETDIEEIEEKYMSWIEMQKTKLTYTKLILQGLYYIYENEAGGYTALHGDRVDMLKTSYKCKRAGDMVVVDGCHVLSVIKDEVWQENEYLAQRGRI